MSKEGAPSRVDTQFGSLRFIFGARRKMKGRHAISINTDSCMAVMALRTKPVSSI